MFNDKKKILAMFIVLCFVLSTMVAFAPKVYVAEIDEDFPLEEGGIQKALIKVNWNPDLESIKFNHDAVVARLKAEAAATQAPILAYLTQKPDAQVLNKFWLDNLILIEADVSTILEIATFSDVNKIMTVFNLTVDCTGEKRAIGDAVTGDATTTWNIQKVRAPEVWDLGIKGEGVRFATTDSGIHLAHPDLAGTLYTDNAADPTYPGGWIEYDANGQIVQGSVPHDTYGHGTATYGLIVGDAKGPYGSVGMAPGAKGQGMHALTLPGGGGAWPQVLAGLQWVIHPTDQYGNPAGAPARVSSHSWGTPGHYHMSDTIDATRNMWLAGHLPCFSAGNGGQGHSGAPGNNYECFSVGATDSADNVASFSSGEWVYKTDYTNPPADWPDKWIHPEVSAPGASVIVPYPPDTYVYWDGTSFSSPHVGGAAVLMLAGNPSLTPAELQVALQDTAVLGGKPDIRYGWGRIDAFEAFMLVALPQGVRGYVTDATTGKPIAEAKVTAVEAARSVKTDANGYYDMRLLPGTYTLTFSRFGYGDETVHGVKVDPDVFTWLDMALTPVPPGYVAGRVYFNDTMIGIPGATVKALDVPVKIEAETDAMGDYSFAIPPGTYNVEASAYEFKGQLVTGVVVQEGLTTTVNFYLTQPPVVAVIGDQGTKLKDFLTTRGYKVDTYTTIAAATPNVPLYSAIIVNRPGSTPTATVKSFIAATDANGVGVVWLDQWYSYCGVYVLRSAIGWPPTRSTAYSTAYKATYYKVKATDPDILPGWSVGYTIYHDKTSTYKMHAWYLGIVDNATVKVLASVGRTPATGPDYDIPSSQGIVKVTRPKTKWMLLSLHANTPYIDVSHWTSDTTTVFLNSINWVAKPAVPHAKFVAFGLTVAPEVGLWSQKRTVSVGIKNVGWITGTTPVEMYVDTTLEGTTTVELNPGEYTYPSWEVSRFNVGTYTAKVRQLTKTFKVRAPKITIEAHEYDKNKPLADAEVYGYYQAYTGPGWFQQWSQSYGGNGHSQFAQPVGDLDNDGVNEVVVGGYESAGMCRIYSYNAALGTYVQEYAWSHGGGTYNSPSGATMLDLDGDGKLELVVSWAYSGSNDGIWAYKWDGTTLTPLDQWYGGFVFDVYSCDYDDDGVKEVLIANAPWGVTPWHVIAFRWENGEFVPEAYWRHAGLTWECMMIWSGDIDNDGKTEVVASISDSYYSTAGTWALHWDSGTGTWTEELVYGDLLAGNTHYGVVVGDVDGDGTPEIGIGNNAASYTTGPATAVLIEWDGTAYKKVWERTWSESPIIEAVDIGDCDNDGKNEFLAGGGQVHIIGWTGSSYVEEGTLPTKGMLSKTIVADCDSDGKNEVNACDIISASTGGPGAEWIYKYTPVPTPLPGWTFKYFGKTDQNGKLVFDSPASVIDSFTFVYKMDKTPLGYQYLLTKHLYIDDDTLVIYAPTSATEALVVSKPNARGLELFPHLGVTWLQYDELPILWPFTSHKTDPTKIVVSPQLYVFRHSLNEIDPFGSWWYYFMEADRIATLVGGQTYSYSFAGPIQAYVKHTQTGSDVAFNWNAWDNYGHQITGISVEEVSWVGDGTSSYVPIPIQPSMLQDVITMVAETIDYYPLIALYDKKSSLLFSGYLQWYEKTASIKLSKQVEYATLSFVAGPYGNPNAKMYVYVIKEA